MAVCRAALVAALLSCIPALSAAVRAPPVHALYCADAPDAPAFFDSASVREADVRAPLAIQRVALASDQPFHLRGCFQRAWQSLSPLFVFLMQPACAREHHHASRAGSPSKPEAEQKCRTHANNYASSRVLNFMHYFKLHVELET